MEITIETREVLAGAYKGSRAALGDLLTHSVLVDLGGEYRTLCRRVSVDNIADRNSNPAGLEEPPTCPKCLSKDPRF